jgi:hypothetical protein
VVRYGAGAVVHNLRGYGIGIEGFNSARLARVGDPGRTGSGRIFFGCEAARRDDDRSPGGDDQGAVRANESRTRLDISWTRAVLPARKSLKIWRPHGDSNPGCIRERDVS